MTDIQRRRSAGGASASLLLLLAILVGAGGYNYWRNLQIEKQEERPRPFESYATDDLEALRGAYEQQVEVAEGRFDAQQRQRVRASGQGLIGERVDEFERIKHSTNKLRALKADVAEGEARLREVDEELRYRSTRLSGMQLHLERLIKI